MKRKLVGFVILSGTTLFAYNAFNAQASNGANAATQVQIGDVAFQLNEAETQQKIVDGSGFHNEKPTTDNGAWLVLDATITNAGLQQVAIDSQIVYRLVTTNGAIYTPTAINMDDFFGVENINPGLQVTGQLAFEVPNNLKDYELQIEYDGQEEIISLP